MESDIIKISHLNKSFGEVKAVNDLSFRVKKGELFAFLGVNPIRSHHPKRRTGFPCRHLRTCVHRLLYPRQYRIQNVSMNSSAS